MIYVKNNKFAYEVGDKLFTEDAEFIEKDNEWIECNDDNDVNIEYIFIANLVIKLPEITKYILTTVSSRSSIEDTGIDITGNYLTIFDNEYRLNELKSLKCIRRCDMYGNLIAILTKSDPIRNYKSLEEFLKVSYINTDEDEYCDNDDYGDDRNDEFVNIVIGFDTMSGYPELIVYKDHLDIYSDDSGDQITYITFNHNIDITKSRKEIVDQLWDLVKNHNYTEVTPYYIYGYVSR